MKLLWKFLLIITTVGPVLLFLSSEYTPIKTFERHFIIPTPKENYADIISTIDTRKLIWDIKSLPSPTHSQFKIKDKYTLYKLGDIIEVSIVLYDSLNRPIKRGGDVILIWMQGGADGAVAGNVKDHGNGSYTGAVRAMWTGSAVIKGAISCSKEGFDFLYYHLRKFGQARRVYCIFQNKTVKENTFGSPTVPLHGQYCNLTKKNYDNPWYCEMPTKSAIQCEDWTGILQGKDQNSDDWLFKTDATLQSYYERAIGHAVFPDIGVSIDTGPTESLMPNEQCKMIPPSMSWSWSTENPTGFFYAGAWHLTRCRFPETDINQCFKNKKVLMYGDSTVRQWYKFLRKNLHLKQIHTGKHSLFTATQEKYNYTIILSPHGTPLYYGDTDLNKYRPIYDQLNDIPPRSRDIVLIHLNAHFQYHHPDLITERLKRTAESVIRLLKRAPDVKVAIKGPHYYMFRGTSLGGMWGPLYDQITRDVFKNLYDRVYLLDYWSMTIAKEIEDVHPNKFIVANMVKTFVGHVCN